MFTGGDVSRVYSVEAISALHVIINKLKGQYGLKKVRLLDVPCGDMQWMSRFLETRIDIDYTGIDIVEDLIKHHQRTYVGRPWTFRNADIVTDDFSNDFDLIISRSMMQHLDNAAVFNILKKLSVKVLHPSFLLATTFSNWPKNYELDTSLVDRSRPLNLEIAPFRLEPPVCLFKDGPIATTKNHTNFMGLWRLPLMTVHESICSYKNVARFPTSLTPGIFYSCVNWKLNNTYKSNT